MKDKASGSFSQAWVVAVLLVPFVLGYRKGI